MEEFCFNSFSTCTFYAPPFLLCRLCVCVRACVCACERTGVHACVRACLLASERATARVCMCMCDFPAFCMCSFYYCENSHADNLVNTILIPINSLVIWLFFVFIGSGVSLF